MKVQINPWKQLPIGEYKAYVWSMEKVNTTKGDRLKLTWKVEAPDKFKDETIIEWFPDPEIGISQKSRLYQRIQVLAGDCEEFELDNLLLAKAMIRVGVNNYGYAQVENVTKISEDEWEKTAPMPAKVSTDIDAYYKKILEEGENG